MQEVVLNHGAGGRDRTGDLLITRESDAHSSALTVEKDSVDAVSDAHLDAPQTDQPGKVVPGTCPCGKPSDGWPGQGSTELCQDCWEAHCSDTWWRAHNAYASQAPPRYRAIVFTGTTQPGHHGTETQTAHEQATFPHPDPAETWLQGRVNATGREGVLLIQREEALRVYSPKGAK